VIEIIFLSSKLKKEKRGYLVRVVDEIFFDNIMNTTIDTVTDDFNGSLVDDWENYKAYTRFYHITDEVFLYANPILILIGK
jgi:hypothetical protein